MGKARLPETRFLMFAETRFLIDLGVTPETGFLNRFSCHTKPGFRTGFDGLHADMPVLLQSRFERSLGEGGVCEWGQKPGFSQKPGFLIDLGVTPETGFLNRFRCSHQKPGFLIHLAATPETGFLAETGFRMFPMPICQFFFNQDLSGLESRGM